MISTHRIMPASHTRQWWLAGGIHPSQVVAAYQPKGAVDLAASYVNLANPGTYDAAPGVAPTLDSMGWKFSSPGNYLDTGVVPGRSWSMFIRCLNAYNYRVICGVVSVDNSRFYLQMSSPSGPLYANGIINAIGGNFASGVIGIAGGNGYKNGDLVGSWSTGSEITSHSIYIGGLNVAGALAGAGAHDQGNVVCFIVVNTTLTPAKIAALSAAMAAL
jgi:hypothetical protein